MCLSSYNIYVYILLFYVPPKMSSRTPGVRVPQVEYHSTIDSRRWVNNGTDTAVTWSWRGHGSGMNPKYINGPVIRDEADFILSCCVNKKIARYRKPTRDPSVPLHEQWDLTLMTMDIMVRQPRTFLHKNCTFSKMTPHEIYCRLHSSPSFALPAKFMFL
jgi:hypothetical protein